MRRSVGVRIVSLLGLVLGTATVHGAVPIRLDDALRLTPSQLSSGPLKLVTGVNYQNRVHLSVDPGMEESYLAFSHSGDVAFRVRTSAFSVRDDGTSVAQREIVLSVSIVGNVAYSDLAVPYSSMPDVALGISFDFDTDMVTLTVTTPANHDEVVLDIDVFATSPVTFVELF